MDSLNIFSQAMRDKGIAFEPGLSAPEFDAIESRYELRFPPDLREFLSLGLPVDEEFPNWRNGKIKGNKEGYGIDYMLDWPYRGMCFDIEHAGFWMRDWGPKPDSLQAAYEIARKMIKAAPRLIPVYSHRYLPAEPLATGNAVISVYQTDIIYYGSDLSPYFTHEFELASIDHEAATRNSKRIRFWSDIIDLNENVIYDPQKASK